MFVFGYKSNLRRLAYINKSDSAAYLLEECCGCFLRFLMRRDQSRQPSCSFLNLYYLKAVIKWTVYVRSGPNNSIIGDFWVMDFTHTTCFYYSFWAKSLERILKIYEMQGDVVKMHSNESLRWSFLYLVCTLRSIRF